MSPVDLFPDTKEELPVPKTPEERCIQDLQKFIDDTNPVIRCSPDSESLMHKYTKIAQKATRFLLGEKENNEEPASSSEQENQDWTKNPRYQATMVAYRFKKFLEKTSTKDLSLVNIRTSLQEDLNIIGVTREERKKSTKEKTYLREVNTIIINYLETKFPGCLS